MPNRSNGTDALTYPTGPVREMVARQPWLSTAVDALIAAFHTISEAEAGGGCLFLCGNGGSLSDALHISGELLKSYSLPRPLPAAIKEQLTGAGPDGAMLAETLQAGLRAVVLGLNHALGSAVENDLEAHGVGYAQELLALGRSGDVLLGISTSGNARNVCYAAQVARALQMPVLALTGQGGGRLASLADITMRAPVSRTERVQEAHIALYHCLCEMLEIHFYGGGPQ